MFTKLGYCHVMRTAAPIASLVATCFATSLGAQLPVQWYPATDITPDRRTEFGMVHDSVRDRLVFFGGHEPDFSNPYRPFFGDTWEWVAGGWIGRPAATAPSARSGHAMAYDRTRQRVILTGGFRQLYPTKFYPPTYYGDTWEWDGVDWQMIAAVMPPRRGHTMTWHAGTGEAIVFGGRNALSALGDTLRLSGGQWQVVAGNGPPAGSGVASAYDDARGRWVVFGGSVVDAWEFDGAVWQQRIATPRPSPRAEPAMAYDPVRQRTVLQGGTTGLYTAASDLWEWDGTSWQLMTSTLPRRTGHQAAWHAGSNKVLMYGGYNTASGPLPGGDRTVRSWDGAVFGLEWENDNGRWLGSLGNSLVSVGANGVFEWIENRWHRIGTAPPNPNFSQSDAMSLVEDTLRQRLVLIDGQGVLQEFDGVAWHGPFANTFPPRLRAAVAFDPARGVVTLFGGYSFGTQSLRNDTWEWNGNSWTAVALANPPAPRSDAALGFDPVLGVMLLHGGSNTGFPVTDTWVRQGSAWQQIPTATLPASGGRLVLHEQEGRLHLGGAGLWRWTGTDWQQVLQSSTYFGPEAYDRATSRLAALPADGEVRYFGPHAAPSVTYSGVACGIGPRPPRMLATPPFLGNSRLIFDVMDAPPLGFGLIALATDAATIPITPNCNLLLGGTIGTQLAFVDVAGFATSTRRVPYGESLRGASFYAQALMLEVSSLQLVTTDRLTIRLGD